MSSLTAHSASRRALHILRLTLDRPCNHNSATPAATRLKSTSNPSPDPLNPQIPVDSHCLPVNPLPPPIPSISPAHISREDLHRLHRLSALNPPAPDSAEEAELIRELGELVGLMEIVKNVQLEEGSYGELLSSGVGELVMDFTEDKDMRPPDSNEGGLRDKDLLKYATRRVGDYYASRVAPKPGSSS